MRVKASLEFNLPEEQVEHQSALAGPDALLVIEDLLSSIRSKLKYDSGFFKEWVDEDGKTKIGDDSTLERVRKLIVDLKVERNIPDLP